MKNSKSRTLVNWCVAVTGMLVLSMGAQAGLFPLGEERPPSRHSDKASPFLETADIPARPHLMLEIGDKFLDTGNLARGFVVPVIGWAVQPRLWAYSTLRSSLQHFDAGNKTDATTEWANRADVFFNLQLSGTEKIILGIRPLDINRPGQFSGYNFSPNNTRDEGWFDNFNAQIRTLFMEGDLGSMFPVLDDGGAGWIDFGFTVGRQPMIFQEGIMINDDLDAVGLVRNNLRPPGFSNLRISALYSWNDNDRDRFFIDRPDSDPELFGLFINADLRKSTINWDMIYTNDDDDDGNGDAFYHGVAIIQRIGHYALAVRANTSLAFDEEIASVATGSLLSVELSKNVSRSDDIVYFNAFSSIENYTQAGREPIVGGPLAAIGILFASPNLGGYGAELSPLANKVAGIATGYQAFWDGHRRNLTMEFAMRRDLSGNDLHDYGLGFSGQQALGRFFLLQLEGFYSFLTDRDDALGGRFEFLIQW